MGEERCRNNDRGWVRLGWGERIDEVWKQLTAEHGQGWGGKNCEGGLSVCKTEDKMCRRKQIQ